MRPVREGDVLRVPLLAELEFRRPGNAIREVSVRSTPPRMSIVPHAGNVIVVEVPSDVPPRPELEVFRGEAAVVEREFVFEGLQLKFEPGLRITFTATLAGPIAADGTVLTSSMVVQPRAANLISVLVRDVRGQVIR